MLEVTCKLLLVESKSLLWVDTNCHLTLSALVTSQSNHPISARLLLSATTNSGHFLEAFAPPPITIAGFNCSKANNTLFKTLFVDVWNCNCSGKFKCQNTIRNKCQKKRNGSRHIMFLRRMVYWEWSAWDYVAAWTLNKWILSKKESRLLWSNTT